MAKKKASRQKHQKDVTDTSEEEFKEVNYQGKVCPHVQRGLNFAKVKRTLKCTNISVCSSCIAESATDELSEIWLCLQCGNTGCGRMSTHKHALQHFKKLHSDCHALILSSSSGMVWCYECDDQVHLQQSRNLRQCVEFLTKGNKTCNEQNQQSLLETVLREQTVVKNNVETKSVPGKNVNKVKKDIHFKLTIKGLRNLGNTCFFNAVMQNLNQTYLLYNVLEKMCSSNYLWEVPKLTVVDNTIVEDASNETLKIPIPPVARQFPLATSLLNFYKQMNSSSLKNEVVNPSALFSEIAKKAPQFKHFQEQDSHELLRQLLDGVRQDEVKRQRRAILNHFDIRNATLDEDTKKLIKAYGSYASHTLVEKIFGGLFISTVLCEECRMSSQVFEPFMDISLPLFEEKHQDNCDQPYLEGGQQQDLKPLRNRKYDAEESNEYVLTKPKREPGKPSKYQERKMKQLARKERRNNRKIKTSASNENPTQVAEEIESELVDGFEISAPETNEKEEANVETEDFEEVNSSSEKLNGDLADNSIISESANFKYADESEKLSMDESEPVISLDENFTEIPVENRNGNIEISHNVKELENQPDTSDVVNEDLVKNLEKISISTLNSLDDEEKMQALGMQVKEIRIRCDSNRQGSLLDSSLSPDEETNFLGSCDSREDTCDNDSEDNWCQTFSESQTKEWLSKSLLPLKPRAQISANECSIDSCLTYFTKMELLTGSNKFRCEKCTEIKIQNTGNEEDLAYTNASKQLLIFSPPAILTLHLKRFQQVGMSLRKVNRFVEFPLVLDLAPYCSSACQILPHISSSQKELLYSLYGVVEHSGRLSSGHYTAYVKAAKRTLNEQFMCHLPSPQGDFEQLLQKFSKVDSEKVVNAAEVSEERQWYYVSDNHVREVSESQVLRCQAYLLFYERIK